MEMTPLWRLHLYPIEHVVLARTAYQSDDEWSTEVKVMVESERCYWEETPEVAEDFETLTRLLFEERPELLADEESYHDYRAHEEQVILL